MEEPVFGCFFKKTDIMDIIEYPQRRTSVKLFQNEEPITYREILPFHLDFEECGTWLKWDTLPNLGNLPIKALTLIDPNADFLGTQPLGIGTHLDLPLALLTLAESVSTLIRREDLMFHTGPTYKISDFCKLVHSMSHDFHPPA